MLPNLPEILISKIMLMREPHPLANMISTNWPDYEQCVYSKCDDGMYDDDYLMTIKAAAHNKDWNEYYSCFTMRELSILGW